jgi:hypothetical protein
VQNIRALFKVETLKELMVKANIKPNNKNIRTQFLEKKKTGWNLILTKYNADSLDSLINNVMNCSSNPKEGEEKMDII